MNFIKNNIRWIAMAVLALVIVGAVLLLLQDDTSSNNKGEGTKVESTDTDKDKDDKDEADEEVKEPNVLKEDGVEAVAIGIEIGKTKYDGNLGTITYDKPGVIIYDSIRKEEINLFFTTSGGKYDNISVIGKGLKQWEEGGIYVNNYKESVAVVKYAEKAYFIYFSNDGSPVVEIKKGDRVSIQGTLLDGEGGRAIFLPVTYEYRGGTDWVIVSREPITPQQKPARHVTTKIVGPTEGRQDRNLFFTLQDGCPLEGDLPITVWDWTDGGIYVDGERVSVPLTKWGLKNYYIYAAFDNWATMNPVKGTRVGIEGTLTDGKNSLTIEPITFEHLGDGKWKVISRDPVIPEVDRKHELKPGEKEVYQYGNYRADKNLFFATSANDKVAYDEGWKVYYAATTNGGVYVDGVRNTGFVLVKTSANGYMLWMEHGGVTPKAGMKITVQGTFKQASGNGEDEITFHPADYEYNGKGWKLVSRNGIKLDRPQPEAGEKEVYLYEDYHTNDKNLHFATSSNDTVPHGNWSVLYKATTGGIFINGVRDAGAVFMKNGENSYLVYMPHLGIDGDVAIGTQIHIEGKFADHITGENPITYHPATFEYDGSNWKLISRESILDRPQPEAGEKEVYLYEDYHANDTNMYFGTSDNDTVPYGSWSVLYKATTGGIFINGVRNAGAVFMKNGENSYLVYMPHLGIDGTPAVGTRIHIEGKFADHITGENPITYHPATFEYDGSNWKLISRESILDRPQPEAGEKEVYLYEDYHANDANMYFGTSDNDAVPYGEWTVLYKATDEGGIYINGVRNAGAVFMKVGANNYLVYMPHLSINGTPAVGTRIHIQGTFVDNTTGQNPITYHPATFEYDGSSWQLVSRDPIVEVETETELTLTTTTVANRDVTYIAADKNLVAGFVASNNVVLADSDYYYPLEGGIYVNGATEPVDNYITKSQLHGSYVYIWWNNAAVGFSQSGKEIAVEEGTKIVIDGLYGKDGQETTFRVNNAKFIYLNGRWASYEEEIAPNAYQYNLTVPAVELRFADMLPGSMTTTPGDTIQDYVGGIYVNDSTTPVRDIRLQFIGSIPAEQLYNITAANMKAYVGAANLTADGTDIKAGTKVRICGVFRHQSSREMVVLIDKTYVYQQNSNGGYDWFNYVAPEPVEADVEYTLTAFAVSNRNVSNNQTPDKNLVAGIKASNNTNVGTSDVYKPLEGGIYVNGSTTPMDNYITKSGNYIYIWSNNTGVGFAQAGKEIAITEGTKLVINGIYGAEGQDAYFEIKDAKFIFLDGKWVSYTATPNVSAVPYNQTGAVAELVFAGAFPEGLPQGWRHEIQDYAGGIYINDSETPLRDIRLYAMGSGYKYNIITTSMRTYMGAANLEADGTTIKAGTKIRICGVFRAANSTSDVVFIDHTYIYKQNSNGGYDWFDYTE